MIHIIKLKVAFPRNRIGHSHNSVVHPQCYTHLHNKQHSGMNTAHVNVIPHFTFRILFLSNQCYLGTYASRANSYSMEWTTITTSSHTYGENKPSLSQALSLYSSNCSSTYRTPFLRRPSLAMTYLYWNSSKYMPK